MEDGIAANYAARSAARFVRPSSRAREPRLGLKAAGSFQAAPTTRTVLRRHDRDVLASLRGGWRSFRAARSQQRVDGRPRPAVAMRWVRSARPGSDRPSSAAAAPWRG
jgi:hypothetical protein